MRVLVINGHPRRDSLATALAKAYVEGATSCGMEVQTISVSNLQFEMNVLHPTPHLQPLEPDIRKSQELIQWAEHIVFVYPVWWGMMPALLKAFLDRTLISHFAFNEIEGGTGYEPLLSGRTAETITTMDTPRWVYRWIYRSPGHRALHIATLGFCGFTMTNSLRFATVRYSTPAKRKEWISKAYAAGRRLEKGALSRRKKITLSLVAWLKALRLQFYPMTFIAYAAGAYGARTAGYGFDKTSFWVGYLWLFLTEVATVLSNEYYDYASDLRNKTYGPFNGGSRVLVTGQIQFQTLKKAMIVCSALGITVFIFLLTRIQHAIDLGIAGAILVVLALGYTMPPLRLCYRSLGEMTVGITHSFAVILCGYLLQGGNSADPFTWLLSLPLCISVLPSIIMASIPDLEADRAANKKTLAVRFGIRAAVQVALVCSVIPTVIVVLFKILNILPQAFNGILYLAIPHSVLLIYLLNRYLHRNAKAGRVDMLIVVSLLYLFWFALVPFLNLT
jgi:1,4-dihydroxy-2-naphthoate octaprenyltransferase